MTPRQYNEMMRQADVLDQDKQYKWKEIEDQFNNLFSNTTTPWEWLKINFEPPTRKPSSCGSYSDLEKKGRGRSKH